jgi:hypothetical protein
MLPIKKENTVTCADSELFIWTATAQIATASWPLQLTVVFKHTSFCSNIWTYVLLASLHTNVEKHCPKNVY